jgi:hypothetical protein
MRYEAIRQDDPVLRERLKELARVRRRFGYRRLHVFPRREGHEANHKRLFRIYREERYISGVAVGASGPSARGPRWCCRSCQTSAGRSTSCLTS